MNSGQLRQREDAIRRWGLVWADIIEIVKDGESLLGACRRYLADGRGTGDALKTYSSPRALAVSLYRARRKYGGALEAVPDGARPGEMA